MSFRPLIGACFSALAVGFLSAAVLAWSSGLSAQRPPPSLGPGGIGALTNTAPAGYVGSATCAGCHATETKAWLTSQHAHAMSRAEPQTVLGNFDDIRIAHRGSSARFFRDGPRFMVETEGADGKTATFEITDTFGIHPLQQYLVTFPDGRRQALPFAYDTRSSAEGGQRWFHLYPDQAIPPSDALYWTGAQQNWNFMCAECHSTALRKNYDPASNRFDTRFSEISVGCESCHGPARGHLDWTRGTRAPSAPNKGFASVAALRPPADWTIDPATGNPSHGASRPAGDVVETCARCHARRGIFSEDWRPGQPLTQTHLPTFLSEGLFEADGMMQDEVFNDHSFKQSLMYARGVTCGDCHEPHSAKLRAPGSAVCGQCHQTEKFVSQAHTGHTPGPKAPDCISCHMPARTYMVVDKRHDHSFRIPRPDLSVRLGTRNACTDCHTDKSAQWAASAIEHWHGPERKGFQNWGGAFHDARLGDPAARDALIRLATTPATPAIVRATAVAELRGFPSIATDAALQKALADPDPLVRIAAVESAAGLPFDIRWRRLAPLLTDPVAGVRIEVANQLAEQPLAQLPPIDRDRLSAAFKEYEAAQRLNADRPEGRSNLGVFLLRQGDVAGAEAEFRAGLKLGAGFPALAVNLADLYRFTGREREAQDVLREAIKTDPDAAAPRHALALALIRQKRYDEALAELQRAYELSPDNARFAYVYAVALQSLGRVQDSVTVIDKALGRSPNDADLLTLALNAALRSGNAARARDVVSKLLLLRPDDAEIARLAAQLR
ncbi:tetratricopeptide repeat protein [Chelatococcus asaccharovorans]|uniref:tetratricopeptide repeat protein n=1 Tax=Chelatococcus asaccharovorans TaxID=28210 RepID=UPI00224C76CE|nr:tetratricopeptide repeat protein [Chelatococcus asaccharovorans]CAH1672349.1 Tetratricopeptide TPR_2 repeat protein [Chelatococcus asaccharovorans]CAH1676232.1 Tetratricopeptide TPR_2 repeat protein [Chelatococcus asaccharovorans]